MKINWHQTPFFRIFFAFALGIIGALNIETNALMISLSVILLGCAVVIFRFIRLPYRWIWLKGTLLMLLFFFLGWQWAFWNDPTTQLLDNQQLIHEKCFVRGRIENLPTVKKTVQLEVMATAAGKSSDSLQAVKIKMLIYLPLDSQSLALRYGDEIQLYSRLSEIAKARNPHQFNYRRYLFYKKILLQSFVQAENWQPVPAPVASFSLMKTAMHLREKGMQHIERHLPNANAQAVAAALLFGYKADLNPDLRAAYANTGAIHVLAVSGLHVGIVMLLLNALLGLFHIKSKWWTAFRVILAIGALWAFAFLTGLSPSVLRATTMFSLLIVGQNLRRYTNIYNTLFASAFLLLIYDPFLIADVGFQLSYSAVLGIVYFQPKIVIWWTIQNKLGDYLWQLTCVSVAAQLATLPFTLFYFHQFPFWFWLSSMVVIPAATVVLGIGIPFLLIGGLLPIAAQGLGLALNAVIWLMNFLIEGMERLPFGLVRGVWLDGVDMGLLLLVLLGLVLFFEERKWRWAVFMTAGLVLLSAHSVYKNWQFSQQKHFVVYALSGSSAVDFVVGKRVISVQSDTSDVKNYEFAALYNHWANGIKSVQVVDYQGVIKNDFLQKERNLIQFLDKTLLILDSNFELPATTEKLKLDYILLSQNPPIRIEEITQLFDFQLLIIDESNNYYRTQQWISDCKRLEIPFHDVAAQNAFIFTKK